MKRIGYKELALKVGMNSRVVIKYTVRFAEKADFEENPNVYKADLIIGHDRIIPAIEEKLMGAEEGDVFEISIPKQASLGAGHPVYATVSVVEIRPATTGEIAARTAPSCGGS